MRKVVNITQATNTFQDLSWHPNKAEMTWKSMATFHYRHEHGVGKQAF